MGSGTVDLQAVFRALVRSGYTGPITFESFSSRVVGQPLEGILGIWRNLWEDSGDLAEHALHVHPRPAQGGAGGAAAGRTQPAPVSVSRRVRTSRRPGR